MKRKNRKKQNRLKPRGGKLWAAIVRLLLSRFAVKSCILVVFLLLVFLSVRFVIRAFTVEELVVKGNKYISRTEVKRLLGVKKDESILTWDAERGRKRLLRSPWIRDVLIRKDLPHRVVVRLWENEPVALLNRKGVMYLINHEGTPLERLNQTVPFLPIIELRSNRKGTLKEAVKLAEAVRRESMFSDRNIKIVAVSPRNITLKIDDMVIKVGRGDYEKKLSRLASLEDTLVQRRIPVEYIDLRFSNRVIVRPVKGRKQ